MIYGSCGTQCKVTEWNNLHLHVNLVRFHSLNNEAAIQELTGSDREYTGAKIDLPATGSSEPVFS